MKKTKDLVSAISNNGSNFVKYERISYLKDRFINFAVDKFNCKKEKGIWDYGTSLAGNVNSLPDKNQSFALPLSKRNFFYKLKMVEIDENNIFFIAFCGTKKPYNAILKFFGADELNIDINYEKYSEECKEELKDVFEFQEHFFEIFNKFKSLEIPTDFKLLKKYRLPYLPNIKIYENELIVPYLISDKKNEYIRAFQIFKNSENEKSNFVGILKGASYKFNSSMKVCKEMVICENFLDAYALSIATDRVVIATGSIENLKLIYQQHLKAYNITLAFSKTTEIPAEFKEVRNNINKISIVITHDANKSFADIFKESGNQGIISLFEIKTIDYNELSPNENAYSVPKELENKVVLEEETLQRRNNINRIEGFKKELTKKDIVLKRDILTGDIFMNKKKYLDINGNLDMDGLVLELDADFQEDYKELNISMVKIEKLLKSHLKRNVYDPRREKLNNMNWDGKSRLFDFLNSLEIKDDINFKKIILVKLLLLIVHTLKIPFGKGISDGFYLVLSSQDGKDAQGAGKSELIKKLCTNEDWLLEAGSEIDRKKRTDLRDLSTAWFIEYAEGEDLLNKKNISKTKSFATRSKNKNQVLYSTNSEKIPTRSISFITTNKENIFGDKKNRRFPLFRLTEKIDFKRWQDSNEVWQLYKEAEIKLYDKGEAYRIEGEIKHYNDFIINNLSKKQETDYDFYMTQLSSKYDFTANIKNFEFKIIIDIILDIHDSRDYLRYKSPNEISVLTRKMADSVRNLYKIHGIQDCGTKRVANKKIWEELKIQRPRSILMPPAFKHYATDKNDNKNEDNIESQLQLEENSYKEKMENEWNRIMEVYERD